MNHNIFKYTCSKLNILSLLKFLKSVADSRAHKFQSICNYKSNLVLAKERLLDIIIFKQLLRTIYYSSTKYSETSALQLCTQSNFNNLYHEIS